MGTSTFLQNVTCSLSTSTNGVNLIGVCFPNNTSTTSSVNYSTINVTSTSTNSDNVYGVYANGSTSNPTAIQPFYALNKTNVNVSSNTAGVSRSLYITGGVQFLTADSLFFIKGQSNSTDVIGVDITNTNAYAILNTCVISASGDNTQISYYDTKQPASQNKSNLFLSHTNLAYSNCLNGFGVINASEQQHCCITGNISGGTYYLTPGNISSAHLIANNVLSIPFSQKCVLYSVNCYYSSPISSGNTITITLYNTTTPSVGKSGTSIVSTTLNSSNNGPKRLFNIASAFDPGAASPTYLQIAIDTNGFDTGYTNGALFITYSLY
jgi:Tfp pilus assembly protein PilX